MIVNDPIADFINRIRNGQKARFDKVDIPSSRMKINLARILKDEGYIRNFKFIKDDKQGILRVHLKYADTRQGRHHRGETAQQARAPVVRGAWGNTARDERPRDLHRFHLEGGHDRSPGTQGTYGRGTSRRRLVASAFPLFKCRARHIVWRKGVQACHVWESCPLLFLRVSISP